MINDILDLNKRLSAHFDVGVWDFIPIQDFREKVWSHGTNHMGDEYVDIVGDMNPYRISSKKFDVSSNLIF